MGRSTRWCRGCWREPAVAVPRQPSGSSLWARPTISPTGARIPLDPAAAVRLVASAAPRLMDVGRVAGRPFVNVATGGFGTEITVETRPELKKVMHGAAYLITGLTHLAELHPVEARFTGPGFSWAGELLVLAVGNGRQAGGGHVLCPNALLDDGLLDVNILPNPARGQRAAALQALLREGKVALWRQAVSARLPWVELEAPEPLQVNLDGEPISGTKLRFEVLPGALQVCAPEGIARVPAALTSSFTEAGSFCRLGLRAQEDHGCVLGHAEWRRRLLVRIELGERRRVLLEVLLQRLDPRVVRRVIGEQLRNLVGIGVLEVLEEPHQAPGVVASLGADVRPGDVRLRFGVT